MLSWFLQFRTVLQTTNQISFKLLLQNFFHIIFFVYYITLTPWLLVHGKRHASNENQNHSIFMITNPGTHALVSQQANSHESALYTKLPKQTALLNSAVRFSGNSPMDSLTVKGKTPQACSLLLQHGAYTGTGKGLFTIKAKAWMRLFTITRYWWTCSLSR